MIKLGSNSIGKIYLGSNSIGKAYLGSNLVFQKGSGPSPSLPYTPVDYIETDGVAYINTGIQGNVPLSMKMNILPVINASTNKYVFGCRRDSGDTRFSFLLFSSDKKAGLAYGSSAYLSDIDISDSVDNQTFMIVQSILSAGNQSIYVKQEGESSYTHVTHTQLTGAVNTNTELYLLALNNYGTASVAESGTAIKTMKLYSDANWTTLIFDGFAVYYNGQYGMWDNITNSFFGNAAGSGAFTGPSINQ